MLLCQHFRRGHQRPLVSGPGWPREWLPPPPRFLPDPTSPCTRRFIGTRTLQVFARMSLTTRCWASAKFEGQHLIEAVDQLAGGGQGDRGLLLLLFLPSPEQAELEVKEFIENQTNDGPGPDFPHRSGKWFGRWPGSGPGFRSTACRMSAGSGSGTLAGRVRKLPPPYAPDPPERLQLRGYTGTMRTNGEGTRCRIAQAIQHPPGEDPPG